MSIERMHRKEESMWKHPITKGLFCFCLGMALDEVATPMQVLSRVEEMLLRMQMTVQDTVERVKTSEQNKKVWWDELPTSQNIIDLRGRTGGGKISMVEQVPPIPEVTASGFDRATLDQVGKRPSENVFPPPDEKSEVGKRGINNPQSGSIE
ncbi:hypothetical protein HZC00_01090 [Candidatus Kaiserbacteria bacterium]|nr:hypothetical protein [Candidatus Kaiserbacteria bacterium]